MSLSVDNLMQYLAYENIHRANRKDWTSMTCQQMQATLCKSAGNQTGYLKVTLKKVQSTLNTVPLH